jgi:beta-aspartyl-dipeptidase (metallo-type)
VATQEMLFNQVVQSVKHYGMDLSEALALVTSNTAKALRLGNKGHVKEGMDADLIILDQETLDIKHVFAKGQHMLSDQEIIVKGTFE